MNVRYSLRIDVQYVSRTPPELTPEVGSLYSVVLL